MGRVDFPDLKGVAELGPDGYLVALYESLGWTRGTELDPAGVTVNERRWLEVCDEYNKLPGPGIGGAFWMNVGPSASADVPYGSIDVAEGAFERPLDDLLREAREKAAEKNLDPGRAASAKERSEPQPEL